MAATPYTGIIVTKPLNPNYESGRPIVLRIAGSDVNNALWTFPDDGSATGYTIPVGTGGLRVVDIKITAKGVDTSAVQLKKGSAPTTQVMSGDLLASNAVDSVTRGQGLVGTDAAPVVLEPGAKYGFIQLT
jgi:acyl transferase domain-containing protein